MSSKKSKSKVFKKQVNQLFDHLVFHVKYNRKVLVGEDIRSRTEQIIREVLDDLGCGLIEANVQPNHVHVLFEFPTSLPLSVIAQKLKAISSKVLREEFPRLVEQIPNALWAPSCCHSTVGSDKRAVVSYIRHQDKHANDSKESKRKRWRRRWQN